jgi:hypothetical protein
MTNPWKGATEAAAAYECVLTNVWAIMRQMRAMERDRLYGQDDEEYEYVMELGPRGTEWWLVRRCVDGKRLILSRDFFTLAFVAPKVAA